MRTYKLAFTAIIAFGLALWTAPRLAAQSGPPPASHDTGQQGEFNGDHQDTGAAAIEGKGEPPEVGETREGSEAVKARSANVAPRAESLKQMEASRERDRIEDARADSNLDTGQRGEYNGDHQDVGAAAQGADKAPEGQRATQTKELRSKPDATSSKEPSVSTRDTDRIQDSKEDTNPK